MNLVFISRKANRERKMERERDSEISMRKLFEKISERRGHL